MSSNFMKYASLVFLSVQTAAHVLVTRYSRTASKDNPYLTSTAVALVEVFKLIICIFVHFCEKDYSISSTARSIYSGVILRPYESLKLSVPAFLYVVQNNLLLIALGNLNSATYQVCYQTKLLTTALFSMCMLGKRLRLTQWAALVMLTAGVAIVQILRSGGPINVQNNSESKYVGLICILAASCLSGFNGVYFEKVLKGSNQSLWIKNIQLAAFSILVAFGSVFVGDWGKVQAGGFFQGYTFSTWMVISLGVMSGLTVALVVKYADNILKGFAVSISIIISTLISFYFLDDFEPSPGFFLGTSLVIGATFLYGIDFNKPKTL